MRKLIEEALPMDINTYIHITFDVTRSNDDENRGAAIVFQKLLLCWRPSRNR
jgi:hypothetical protein